MKHIITFFLGITFSLAAEEIPLLQLTHADYSRSEIDSTVEINLRDVSRIPENDQMLLDRLVQEYPASLDECVQFLLTCSLEKILPALEQLSRTNQSEQSNISYFKTASALLKALESNSPKKIKNILANAHDIICDNAALNMKFYQALLVAAEMKLQSYDELKDFCCCKRASCFDDFWNHCPGICLSSLFLTGAIALIIVSYTNKNFNNSQKLAIGTMAGAITFSLIVMVCYYKRILSPCLKVKHQRTQEIIRLLSTKKARLSEV